MKCFAFGIVIILLTVGCTHPIIEKISDRRQMLHAEGRICDDCAENSFADYRPCWEPPDGKKPCSICAYHKCCKEKKDDCCCWHNKENCWKKCKIPRTPVR